MIFKSQAREEILKTKRQLNLENWETENRIREKLKDFYEGRQLASKYYDEYGYKNPKIPLAAVNITKKIVDKISLIYKYAPERFLDIEAETDNYRDYIQQNPRFNLSLKIAERYKNLLYKILYRPVYDEIQGKWHYYIETEYEPHFTGDNMLTPFAYSIPIKIANTRFSSIFNEDRWMFYSKDMYFFHDNDFKAIPDPDHPDMINPYGIIPFVELRADVPVDKYDTQGMLELIQANQAINIALMNLNMMIHFQAFGILTGKNISEQDAGKIKIGADKIALTGDGDLSILNTNPMIAETIEAIKQQIQLIAWTYNLSINWTIEGTPASGFSLIVQNIDLLEQRHDDVELAELQEKEIYEVIAMISKYHNLKPALMPDAELHLDFQDIDFPINQKEELERWEWELSHNAKSIVDYIQSQNPEMSEEEAIEKFNRNKILNGKFSFRDKIAETIINQGGEITGGNGGVTVP